MKIGTAEEMPKLTKTHGISWREFAEALQRGEIRTVACEGHEQARKIQTSGRTSMWRFIKENQKLVTRIQGATVYFRIVPRG